MLMKTDDLGIPIFTNRDLVDMIYEGNIDKCNKVLCEKNDDIQKFNKFAEENGEEKLKEYVESKTTKVKLVKQTNLLVSGVNIVPGMFFINDVVVRNNNGTSEIYVAAGSRKWDRVLGTRSDAQNTILGSGHDGIYLSLIHI